MNKRFVKCEVFKNIPDIAGQSATKYCSDCQILILTKTKSLFYDQ